MPWSRARSDRRRRGPACALRRLRTRRLLALAAGALAPAALTAAPGYARGPQLELGPLTRPARAHVAALARPGRAHSSRRRGPSVGVVLERLRRSGAISAATAGRYRSAYLAATRSLARLAGTRRTELSAVVANVQAMAVRGQLSASRLPAVFLTLERNQQWWTREPLLAAGAHLSFPASKLVWEYYPGQGLEIQWLATFGKANGYYLSGHEDGSLRQLLDEALRLASRRAGGIAWEYLFQFDGGQPPWTSGLSQGTAIQALARGWSRLKEPAYRTAAQQALGVLQTPPAQGVRVQTPAGAYYAQYSYAPGDRILNGFVQALVGLYDYAAITRDPLGLQLFEAGDAEARLQVPRYDTGAWSRYDQYGESSLSYHELLTEFLEHLCQRTQAGPPFTAPGLPAQEHRPIAADRIYCTTAARFKADLRTPPAVALLTHRLPGGTRAGVQLSLSKISTVALTVRQGARVVWTNRATVAGGKPRLLWITPAAGGSFSVTLTASDLAGNFATANGTIVVTRR